MSGRYGSTPRTSRTPRHSRSGCTLFSVIISTSVIPKVLTPVLSLSKRDLQVDTSLPLDFKSFGQQVVRLLTQLKKFRVRKSSPITCYAGPRAVLPEDPKPPWVTGLARFTSLDLAYVMTSPLRAPYLAVAAQLPTDLAALLELYDAFDVEPDPEHAQRATAAIAACCRSVREAREKWESSG